MALRWRGQNSVGGEYSFLVLPLGPRRHLPTAVATEQANRSAPDSAAGGFNGSMLIYDHHTEAEGSSTPRDLCNTATYLRVQFTTLVDIIMCMLML